MRKENAQYDFVKSEHGVLKFWRDTNVFDKMVRKGRNSPYLEESRLKPGDIVSAEASPDGSGGYDITITLKDGATWNLTSNDGITVTGGLLDATGKITFNFLNPSAGTWVNTGAPIGDSATFVITSDATFVPLDSAYTTYWDIDYTLFVQCAEFNVPGAMTMSDRFVSRFSFKQSFAPRRV